MPKRPAFQFYPGDWRRDAALQSCSVAARGLWAEMMCIMHDGSPYGHLRVGSKDIDPSRLARMVGADTADVEVWLAELEEAEVFSRTEEGTIYCRRMVRDEDIREKRAEAGSKGGKKAAKRFAKAKSQAKPEQSVADADAVEESSKETKEELRRRLFEDEFWPRYPKRAGNRGKKQAAAAWRARCREGVDPEAMIEAAKRYHRYCEVEGRLNTGYVLLASTFLNDPENFTNPWTPTTEPKKQAKAPPPTPDSEAAKVRSEKPQQIGERTGKLTLVGKSETEKEERRRKVEEWKRQNADELDALRTDAVDEIGLALQAFAKKPDVARRLVEARVDEIIWNRKLEGAA